MKSKRFRFTVRRAICVTLAVGGAGSLALRLYVHEAQDREARHRWYVCSTNVNLIILAMSTYVEQFGTFPPRFESDDSGKRTQSWRASLLPLVHPQLFMDSRYKLKEPWDSKHNARFAAVVPSVYTCPENTQTARGNCTSFFMVNDLVGLRPDQVPANAVLLIEIKNTGHDWRDPYDDLDALARIEDLESIHPNGFSVVLCDFRLLHLRNATRIKKEGGFYVVVD